MEKGCERQLRSGDKIAFSLNLGFCGKKSRLVRPAGSWESFF